MILNLAIEIPRFPNNWEQIIVAHINDPYGHSVGQPDIQPMAVCINRNGGTLHFIIDNEGNIKLDGQLYQNTGDNFYRGVFVYTMD